MQKISLNELNTKAKQSRDEFCKAMDAYGTALDNFNKQTENSCIDESQKKVLAQLNRECAQAKETAARAYIAMHSARKNYEMALKQKMAELENREAKRKQEISAQITQLEVSIANLKKALNDDRLFEKCFSDTQNSLKQYSANSKQLPVKESKTEDCIHHEPRKPIKSVEESEEESLQDHAEWEQIPVETEEKKGDSKENFESKANLTASKESLHEQEKTDSTAKIEKADKTDTFDIDAILAEREERKNDDAKQIEEPTILSPSKEEREKEETDDMVEFDSDKETEEFLDSIADKQKKAVLESLEKTPLIQHDMDNPLPLNEFVHGIFYSENEKVPDDEKKADALISNKKTEEAVSRPEFVQPEAIEQPEQKEFESYEEDPFLENEPVPDFTEMAPPEYLKEENKPVPSEDMEHTGTFLSKGMVDSYLNSLITTLYSNDNVLSEMTRKYEITFTNDIFLATHNFFGKRLMCFVIKLKDRATKGISYRYLVYEIKEDNVINVTEKYVKKLPNLNQVVTTKGKFDEVEIIRAERALNSIVEKYCRAPFSKEDKREYISTLKWIMSNKYYPISDIYKYFANKF